QGVYVEITEQMAHEADLTVDRAGYDKLFEEFREHSSEGRKKVVVTAVKGELPKTDDSPKYGPQVIEAKVLGWVQDNAVVTKGRLSGSDDVALLLDRTNFYAEQGGQVGDSGEIVNSGLVFEVSDTQRLGDAILHVGRVVKGGVEVGEKVHVDRGLLRRT